MSIYSIINLGRIDTVGITKNMFFDLDLTSRHPQFLGQVYISGQFKFFFLEAINLLY